MLIIIVSNIVVIPVKVASLSKEQEYYRFCDMCFKKGFV